MLAYYHVNEQFRIGGGAQFVGSPELKGSGVASGLNVELESATGAVIEGEYLISPKMGLKLRYVNVEFEPTGGGPKADGSHLGLMFNYYL